MKLSELLLSLAMFCGLFVSTTRAATPEMARNVTYATIDGKDLTCDVYLPPGDGPAPGVLVVHGGAWTIGGKGQLGFVGARLAHEGFTAVLINYRLAPQHVFPAQIDDCRAAVRFMRSNAAKYRIDPERLGGFGYSAGGQLVSLLATTAKETDEAALRNADPLPSVRLQAVVAGGAPCDFCSIPPRVNTLGYWLGGTRQDKPEAYRLASPAQFVSADDTPIWFFQGEKDDIVRPSDPKAMHDLLLKAGVAAQWHVVAGKGHVMAMFDESAVNGAVKFLADKLKPDSTTTKN